MGVLRSLGRWLGLGRATPPPAHIAPGARVRLRSPLATSHKVWIPVGAAGIVVGWDTPAHRVSVELDTPRTVVTVPWSWVEEEREPPSGPTLAGRAPSAP